MLSASLVGGISKSKPTDLVIHPEERLASLPRATTKSKDWIISILLLLLYVLTHFALCAAGRDLEIILLDVKTAFLKGRVDEEIYIAQPEGYIVSGHETNVCRLNKSIYGICQAGRIWYKTLHYALIDFGFVQSKADPCVYFYYTKDLFVIFASWVDDGFLTGNSLTFIQSSPS